MQIALGVLGFGLVGIDPMGAILLAAASATESRRGRVIAFLVAALVATVVAGTTLALAGRGLVEAITSALPSADSSAWLAVNVAVITVIVVVLGRRFARRRRPSGEAKVRTRKLLDSPTRYTVAGAVFGLTSVTDPTLYGAVALAAESGNIAAMAAAGATWFLVSQVMLVAYVIGFLLGAHTRLVAGTRRWWTRQRDRFEVALYVAATVVVLVLLADSVTYASTGDYLLAF